MVCNGATNRPVEKGLLFWCSLCVTMTENGEARFREPKIVLEELELVEKATLSSTKYKETWAATNFGKFICLL